MDRAYRRLSKKQRAAISLNYAHGYSVDECALFMGCRPGTVRTHLERGLATLRKDPASWHIVIPVTGHTGSAVLPAFIPVGWEYIQYACVGTGHLQILTTDGTVNESLKPCSNSSHPVNAQISGAYGPLKGIPVALKVVTSPSVRWEIVVAETATPLPLPSLPPLPADAEVLVPLTYGQGIAALPSFTPHTFITIDWWCSGPGGIQVFVSNGYESEGASVCGVGGAGGTNDYTGNRETLVVDVSPNNAWEIRVYWQPNQSSG
jgi:hypothetical protein